jgi:hypothetical protein
VKLVSEEDDNAGVVGLKKMRMVMRSIGLTSGCDGSFISSPASMISSEFVFLQDVSWTRTIFQHLVQVSGCVVAGFVGTTIPF